MIKPVQFRLIFGKGWRCSWPQMHLTPKFELLERKKVQTLIFSIAFKYRHMVFLGVWNMIQFYKAVSTFLTQMSVNSHGLEQRESRSCELVKQVRYEMRQYGAGTPVVKSKVHAYPQALQFI